MGTDENSFSEGLNFFTSTCGTYVVREKCGLVVKLCAPNDEEESNSSLTLGASQLVYGQKVQVVAVSGGVARLARNKGFIVANSSQLVKVGEAKEKSCKIEGLVEIVLETKTELEKQLKLIKRKELILQRELNNVLSDTEEHPVIEEYQPFILDTETLIRDEISTSTTATLSNSSSSQLNESKKDDRDFALNMKKSSSSLSDFNILEKDDRDQYLNLKNTCVPVEEPRRKKNLYPRRSLSSTFLEEMARITSCGILISGCSSSLFDSISCKRVDKYEEKRKIITQRYHLNQNSKQIPDYQTGMSCHNGPSPKAFKSKTQQMSGSFDNAPITPIRRSSISLSPRKNKLW